VFFSLVYVIIKYVKLRRRILVWESAKIFQSGEL